MNKMWTTLLVMGVIILGYVLYIDYDLNNELQNISIETNIESGLIVFDGDNIGYEKVCLPNVKIGEHEVFVMDGSDEKIRQSVKIGDVNSIVNSEIKDDNQDDLSVKLTNCGNWE